MMKTMAKKATFVLNVSQGFGYNLSGVGLAAQLDYQLFEQVDRSFGVGDGQGGAAGAADDVRRDRPSTTQVYYFLAKKPKLNLLC